MIFRPLVLSAVKTLILTGWLLLFSIPFLSAFSQESYHITNYRKVEYKAGNQNWDIDIDEKGNVYIANSKGLLVLKGSATQLYELPYGTIIRSVAVINDRIYTGSFKEFGYWEPDRSGKLIYTSLVPLLSDDSLVNDEFWSIVEHNNKIYFQSFGRLLCYDYQKVKPVPTSGPVLFLHKCRNRLFIQVIGGGLYEIIDQTLQLLPGSQIFSNTEIKAILPLTDDEFIFATNSEGLFHFDGKDLRIWPNEAQSQLMEFKINNGIRASNWFVFGTIMKGIFIISTSGELLGHLHAETGLQNNTVLSLKNDVDNNLWVALDKGFDYVSFNTPLSTYIDSDESFGTVYSASLDNGNLYIGTNQGIYLFKPNIHDGFGEREFLNESQGQVWFIKKIDEKLYCGHNSGTYLIENKNLVCVSGINGGYNLKKITDHDEEILLQSSYTELVVYRKKDEIWTESHTIAGFEAPARFLETDHLGNLWLGHSIAGIYKLQPDNTFNSVITVWAPGEISGIHSSWNRVFKIDNRIVVPTGETLLQWDALQSAMVPMEEIVGQLEGFETARMIVPADRHKYWFIKDNELGMFEIRFGKAKLLYRIIPEMYNLNLVEDYENIVALNDSLHLICLENGFSILNLHRLHRLSVNNHPPVISEIYYWKDPDKIGIYESSEGSRILLSHFNNNLTFVYSAPGPFGKKKFYQYMLDGIENTWSDWTTTTRITYNRLPPGSYNFKVRTLDNQGIITEETHQFVRIRPPWYLSGYSIFLYVIMIIGIGWMLRLVYLRRNWKKREALLKKEQEELILQKEQAQSEVIRLSNEKLQSEIAMKNSQLANNTITLIRKNELLVEIQAELQRQKDELGARIPKKYFTRLSKLIETNLESDQDWEVFEKLFDQAHENFFQRLKSDYPDLTSSDLRLCAYLRLNLTSKEIAPLLNISVRGVEERRYRIRKRLKLTSEVSLTDFILTY